jgi:hypothetical protein
MKGRRWQAPLAHWLGLTGYMKRYAQLLQTAHFEPTFAQHAQHAQHGLEAAVLARQR